MLLLLSPFPLGERDEPTTFDYVSIAIAASVVGLIVIIVLTLFIVCCIWYMLCWKPDDVNSNNKPATPNAANGNEQHELDKIEEASKEENKEEKQEKHDH